MVRTYLEVILFIALLLCGIQVMRVQSQRDVARQEVINVKNQLALQNSAIEVLHQESARAQKKLEEAHKKAHETFKKSQAKLPGIMATTVPNDCVLAVRWAALEAIKMRQ